ncbi:response regulator [Aquincola sp. MAHUQ-54]|uniref:histidine kinase n=1 Tax=Aquincola agrisoli TaxID=3119538 RepID=A0AAW9QBQ5_9BURK
MRAPSFQKAVYAGFTLAIAAALALGVLTWIAAGQSQEAAAFVRETRTLLLTLTAAESSFNRAEAAQRAFINLQRPVYLEERDAAILHLSSQLDELERGTAGIPGQAQRVSALRAALEDRQQAYREVQALFAAGQPVSLESRLAASQRLLGRIRQLLSEMNTDIRRRLEAREALAAEQANTAKTRFFVFGAALVLLLGLMFWRVRSDLLARARAEAEASRERELNAMHARALTLFNAKPDRGAVLEGTLALLADDGGLFPISAFYGLEEWGSLRLLAARGVPADTKPLLDVHDGTIGRVALQGERVYLETFDEGEGLRIETGLATLKPAALLMVPVSHQGRRFGVLVLGAARRLPERDQQFVERLAAQLGVALHNLAQLDGLNLLARELRDRGEDIQRKNEQLEHANRLKSEFVASMSHELRTPLNAVIGFSEILRDGLVGTMAPQQVEYVNDIYQSGRHLLALINDILDLSKIEAGQMTLSLGAESPSVLAGSGLAVVRERAAARRITLHEEVAPDLGRLLVDSRRTLQVLFNLLSNAVKFTPEGGHVTLSMARVAKESVLQRGPSEHSRLFPPACAEVAHYLEIRVADTGIGIAPAALRELFQPFKQIDSSLSKRYEGTGLGLTTTQRMVELHGGGLEFYSREGEGSVFTVWLPWREPGEGAVRLATLPPPRGAGGEEGEEGEDAAGQTRILVIEDDATAAQLVRVQLESHGYKISVVPDAEQGLAAALQWRPHAIVLDVILPGMHGWDMLARLKEVAATQRIPVVIVSITDEPHRGFALGASQVLMKPVDRDDLLAALASMGLSPDGEPGRVLVVDDDPRAVTMVCTHLEAAGFAPLCAFSGEEALSIVRSQRPDLIVLDLMMPRMSGFDVLEVLARRPETASIAILVLTAKLVTEQDREMLRGRVQTILEKADFQPNQLVAEVRRALHRRRLEPPAGAAHTS